MANKDYYQVLGIKPDADTEEIRQVYKKLALQYHPDRNPGNQAAEDRFKEISEAKEILLDPANRRQYDLLRQQYFARQRQQQRPGTPPPIDPEEDFSLGSFLDEILGKRRKGPRRGKHYEANVKISLEEAYRGMTDVLKFEGRKLRVRIRPGIQDGQTLRIKNQGGPGKQGGSNGDLYLTVKIHPHAQFERKENDLYHELPIDLYDWLLGKKLEVPSFAGNKSIALPKGTQPGERLKLKGLGMPHYDDPDQKGDLFILVQVRLPEQLTQEELELIRQLARKRGKD